MSKTMNQDQIAEARRARAEKVAHMTGHQQLAGKPLAEAEDLAERVAIKLARLGRAVEAYAMRTNDMHLVGMVREALDDDDEDAVDQPTPEPDTVPETPRRRKVK